MRRCLTKTFGDAFSVGVVPTLKDNFSYVIHDHATGTLAAVDTNADVEPILSYINGLSSQGGSIPPLLRLLLTTHKHWDHSGGNEKLQRRFSGDGTPLKIVGGAKDSVPGVTKTVKEGDVFKLGNLQVAVLDVPCHTKGHVMYKVQHPGSPQDGIALFTGDTLFIAGIGAFFEGTPQDMCAAVQKIFHLNQPSGYELDDRTFIFPGHEYTAGFMKFSLKAYPDQGDADYAFIQEQAGRYAEAVRQGNPSVPSSLAEEKRQNLFLRVAERLFRERMGKGGEVQLMDYLYNACD